MFSASCFAVLGNFDAEMYYQGTKFRVIIVNEVNMYVQRINYGVKRWLLN